MSNHVITRCIIKCWDSGKSAQKGTNEVFNEFGILLPVEFVKDIYNLLDYQAWN